MNRATIVRRTSTFSKCVALLLCSTLLSLAEGSNTMGTPAQSQPGEQASAKAEQSTNQSSATQATSRGFLLEDSTPVKLRINRTVSSADAQVGDNVDFEVLEDVSINGVLVIAKGGYAVATVTTAQAKRRMARGGKLDINIDYVRLLDGEKAALRAVKEVKGGGHTGAMTGGIVATSLVFFPAAPFFLFMHGKDITIPQGTEVTAYVNGEMKLDVAKFQQGSTATPSMPAVASAAVTGTINVATTPDGAEVYVDNLFYGNSPATLKLKAGKHTITVKMSGYKDWSRDLSTDAGSEARLTAALEKSN